MGFKFQSPLCNTHPTSSSIHSDKKKTFYNLVKQENYAITMAKFDWERHREIVKHGQFDDSRIGTSVFRKIHQMWINKKEIIHP